MAFKLLSGKEHISGRPVRCIATLQMWNMTMNILTEINVYIHVYLIQYL